MSERSTEDEIRAEFRQFAHALPHLLRLHAQAGNWLERRRIRKQINLALREQRRAEDTVRAHHLTWTQQAVERYRGHVLAVGARAQDPSVDHRQRYEDAQAVAEHSAALRSQIALDDRLTLTERGIALDGVDAVTTFPHLRAGRLFEDAHKVKGTDALRYRAQVARTLGADTYTRQLPRPAREKVDHGGPERQITAAPVVAEHHAAPDHDHSDRDHKEGDGGQRLAEVERRLRELQQERDRLESRVSMVQRGLDAVTADRDQLRGKLDTVEAEVAGLRTRNQRLAAEIGDLRERGQGQPVQRSVAEHLRHFQDERDQARRERDRLKHERDQARAELTDHSRGTGRDEAPPVSSAGVKAVREWNELVGRNIGEALQGIEHPEIAERDLGQVQWGKFTNGTESAEDVARWWAEDGAAAYWAEHDSRNHARPAPGRPEPASTQSWQPTGEQPEREQRNWRRRNGIERSR